MNLAIVLWMMSLSGALLFFFAGALFARGRELSRADRATRPLHSTESGATGDVLRRVLERETRGSTLDGAVIADELGLVVASTGNYGEALAAYGAVLAGLGEKTRDVLPLHDVRRVVIEDDEARTLIVRPISTAAEHFSLVTLATQTKAQTNKQGR
jgi:predicted regulator of Ras-like GTPase activity (Roadblock/LC7/MglB family)